MYFTKIELHNFGIYKGTQTIQLMNQVDKRNITLIGGMNGRGKTTLLDAIFLTFFGKRALKYIRDDKRSYQAFLFDYINKSATDDSTFVSVSLKLEDEDNTELQIIRSWNGAEKKVSEKLEVIKNGSSDSYLSENWDFYVEDILPFGISRFFFFDNEKISQIADDESFEDIKDSIKSVIGITTIDKLLEDIQKIMKEKKSSLKAFENSELTVEIIQNEQALAEIEKAIREEKDHRSSLIPKLEKVEAELENIEQNFWKHGGNLGLKREEIEKQKDKLKAEGNNLRQKMLNLANNPATPLALCKTLVIDAYNAAKEEEAQTAKKYSEHIVKALYEKLLKKVNEMFFYDTAIRTKIIQLIKDQFEEYNSDWTYNPQNTLSPTSFMLMEKLIHGGFQAIQNTSANLRALAEENYNALLQIDMHLNNNAEKSEAFKLLSIIRELEATKTTLELEIKKSDENLNSLKYQKNILESQRKKIIRKLAEIENTYDDDARIVSYAARTIDVMQEFKVRLQKRKVEQLEKNIMDCFRCLAQKESIITSVEINPQTLDILLKDYKGGILLKNQLSSGEKQIFAISIIWGLARSSGYKLPVIIDTPLARLDSVHRKNFINKYLPNASSQVIVLSTDEEIYGKYLYQIHENVNTYYTLLYNENEK
ncbi:MAG: sulfur modification protein DndD [Eubacteriaceae bacterium]|nr:sulfur modification protein DndD [Eubacteriaceae bacterium]